MPPRTLMILMLAAFLRPEARALEVPKLAARVTDLAGLLTAEQVAALDGKLRDLESTDSTQVAVLVVPSLEGEALEDYTERVASAWRLGQKGRDNGALLFLAMKERKLRIEVGYGLEPTLTDARSRHIIQNEIVPRFRQGGYFEGIEAGVEAMIRTVRGTYQTGPRPARAASPRRASGDYLHWIVFLFLPFLWLAGALGAIGTGLVGSCAGAVLAFMFAGWSLPLVLSGGVGGFLAGLVLGRVARAARSMQGGRTRTRGGAWIPGGGFSGSHGSGGFFGGFTSGGGFSGGGFSGGGGSFGGGGSSGSW